jgi:hypothetical protein
MEDLNQLQYDSLKAQDIRYDPNDTAPDYIGLHELTDAPTADPNWMIYKFTYSGTATTRTQKTKGSWDDRATLF